MNNPLDTGYTMPQSEMNGVEINVFELRNSTIIATREAMNDSFYITFLQDPIGFLESRHHIEIQDALQLLSMTSTRGYIQSFIRSMRYTIDFESCAGHLFITHGDKKQKLIMAIIYLIEYKNVEKNLSDELISMIVTCTAQEALSARNTMTRIGLCWTDDTLTDPIFAQFLTKAAYIENGLQKIVNS